MVKSSKFITFNDYIECIIVMIKYDGEFTLEDYCAVSISCCPISNVKELTKKICIGKCDINLHLYINKVKSLESFLK